MKTSVKDRRIERTRRSLHDALISLIREKDYDQIVVKEILDRANVGRSTFYMHFRDKDDLLASGIHLLLGPRRASQRPVAGRPHQDIIAFALPIFEHVYEHHQSPGGKLKARGRAILHEHLQQVLASRIESDVRKGIISNRRVTNTIPPELLVRFIASTFVLVLNWWMERESPLPPKEIHHVLSELLTTVLTPRSPA